MKNETFKKNLTFDRAKDLLDNVIAYVESSCTDSQEMAEDLMKNYGFTEYELFDLGYGPESIVDEIVKEEVKNGE